jgi:hypothetical protein
MTISINIIDVVRSGASTSEIQIEVTRILGGRNLFQLKESFAQFFEFTWLRSTRQRKY